MPQSTASAQRWFFRRDVDGFLDTPIKPGTVYCPRSTICPVFQVYQFLPESVGGFEAYRNVVLLEDSPEFSRHSRQEAERRGGLTQSSCSEIKPWITMMDDEGCMRTYTENAESYEWI